MVTWRCLYIIIIYCHLTPYVAIYQPHCCMQFELSILILCVIEFQVSWNGRKWKRLAAFLKTKVRLFFFRCHFLGNMNNLMGSSITDTQEYVNIIIRNIIFINNMNSIRNNRTINNIGIEYVCLFYDGIWGTFCMTWTSAGLVVVKMTLSAIQSSSVSWSIITKTTVERNRFHWYIETKETPDNTLSRSLSEVPVEYWCRNTL